MSRWILGEQKKKGNGDSTTVFPRGPPPQYYPGQQAFNFRVLMGSGAFASVWPSPKSTARRGRQDSRSHSPRRQAQKHWVFHSAKPPCEHTQFSDGGLRNPKRKGGRCGQRRTAGSTAANALLKSRCELRIMTSTAAMVGFTLPWISTMAGELLLLLLTSLAHTMFSRLMVCTGKAFSCERRRAMKSAEVVQLLGETWSNNNKVSN